MIISDEQLVNILLVLMSLSIDSQIGNNSHISLISIILPISLLLLIFQIDISGNNVNLLQF